MTGSILAPEALLPDGWAQDVLLEWDAEGRFTAVTPGADPVGVERAPGTVLPGMPNLHSHAFQRAMAGLAEVRGHPTDDFWTWREAMYHLVRTLEPDDVEAIATYLYIEMLEHGYTSVAEFHYLHHDRDGTPYADRAELAWRILAAARESGIALTLLPVLYAHGGFGHRPLNAAQKRFGGTTESIAALLADLAPSLALEPHLRLGLAPHSVRAVDALTLTEAVAAMEAIDPTAPLHMHASEQTAEVEECLATHGATPIAWAMQLVDMDRRWCLVHATHATEAEREMMRMAQVAAGLCPMTEANLGDGIFPFADYAALAGRWGIGGDSHVSVSPFEELRALEYSQRLALRLRNVTADETAPDVAANLWRGAAFGGARAIGQPAGSLDVGKRADFVVLDGDDIDFEGLADGGSLAVALFSGSRNRVREAFVAGRQVVVDGRHPGKARAAVAYRRTLARLRAKR